jgi:hypothetical protein
MFTYPTRFQAADLCIAALPFLNRYEQIKALLNLAKGMQVTGKKHLQEEVHLVHTLISR